MRTQHESWPAFIINFAQISPIECSQKLSLRDDRPGQSYTIVYFSDTKQPQNLQNCKNFNGSHVNLKTPAQLFHEFV